MFSKQLARVREAAVPETRTEPVLAGSRRGSEVGAALGWWQYLEQIAVSPTTRK